MTGGPAAGGTVVRVAFTKHDGSAHWAYDAVVLGRDRHGTWLGVRAGTVITRPGRQVVAGEDQVVLAPDGTAVAAGWWLATFHDPAADPPQDVYVDVATPPVTSTGPAGAPPGGTIAAVDLDLDVLRDGRGRCWLEDEDELVEHAASMGYPEDLVRSARAAGEALVAAVGGQVPPFDAGTPARWLAALRLPGVDGTDGRDHPDRPGPATT